MSKTNKFLLKFLEIVESPTLNTMKFFMNTISCRHPHKIEFIHIAGTNGKGSVATIISQILIEAGLKTGKFTTPFLEKDIETISIDNKMITNKEAAKILKKIRPITTECNLKYEVKRFEVLTMIAITNFVESKCDFAVLETGIGGTTDSTNVITPLISIITSIGLDHQDILGNSIESIAEHKFGIIKNGGFVIVPNDIPEQHLLREIVSNKGCTLIKVNADEASQIHLGDEFTSFTYNGEDYRLSLVGKKQIQNAIIAIECARIINQCGYKISKENIKLGLKKICHRGRWEKILKNPLIIFDGAHNEQAIENFTSNVNQLHPNVFKKIVFSCLKSKDYRANISQLKSIKNCHIIFTSGINEKFVDAETLFKEGQKIGLNCSIDKKFSHAVRSLKKEKNTVCFVLGSFYVYKKTLKILHVKH